MSLSSPGTDLKTAGHWSDLGTVSALRNHVHYIVNYVFEGRRPQGPPGEVVERSLVVRLEGRS